MKLGLQLPIGTGALGGGRAPRWSELREIARTAEALGFDTILVPDHLLFRRSPPGNVPAMELPPGKSRGMWEAWSILAAVAEATSRIELGPLMTCAGFRNPALVAKMASTLDEISGGRVVLGLGAGWHQPEFEAFGFPFDARVSRFEEALRIILPLLRDGRADFQGRHHTVRDCQLIPRGPRPAGPPIWIGGQGPRMLRLAARHADTYDADYQMRAETVAERFAGLDAACAEVGRDPTSIGRAAGTRVALAGDGLPDAAWQIVRPVDGVAAYDFDGAPFPARYGSPEEILAHVRGFATAGVEHLTVNVVDPPGVRGLERFAPLMRELSRA